MRRCSTAALINNEHDTQGAGLDVSTNSFVTPEKQLEAIVLTFPLENTLEPGMVNNESGCSHYLEEFWLCVLCVLLSESNWITKKPNMVHILHVLCGCQNVKLTACTVLL